MKGSAGLRLPKWGCTLLILLVSVYGSIPRSLVDIASRSRLVLLATVAEVGDASATFEIVKTYRGEELLKASQGRIRVAPTGILDMRLPSDPADDQQFMLFLNPSTDGETFTPAAYGQWCIEVGPQRIGLQTLEHLIETWFNPDERERIRVLIDDCQSSDEQLRSHARVSLLHTIRRSGNPADYKEVILSFLDSDDPERRSLGLALLQGLRVEEAIPRLLSLAEDPDAAVVERVSLALREYRTPEVARTLAGLMKHPDPRVRVRAALDTDHMDDPEVILGLVSLASDPDPQVRAMVPRGFHFHSTTAWSEVFHPVLLRLANDSDSEVRSRALHALGDNRRWELIPTGLVIERLKQDGLAATEARAALECLYVACSNRPKEGSRMVEANEDLLIGYLMNEADFMIGFTVLGLLDLHPCPKAAAAISRAARNHKYSQVRHYAQRLMESPGRAR